MTLAATRRDAGVGAGGLVLGIVLGAVVGGPVAPPVYDGMQTPQGVISDRLETAEVVKGAGGRIVRLARTDPAGVVVDVPEYSPQYVAHALIACDRAEAEAGGGYVAPRRARWEALAAKLRGAGVELPPPSAESPP